MNLLDRIGDWNPQLFRELKGRIKFRNLAIASAISLVGQLLLLANFLERLPTRLETDHHYCTGGKAEYYYLRYLCVPNEFGQPMVNWQLWWMDLFIWLSLISTFTLLVVGVNLLIRDLAKEEHRGTLNFIRLSPQSTQSLLSGKLLGVPILLYLGWILSVPMLLWAGISAQIPVSLILGYYALVFASCLFFYSGALLFGIVGAWMGGIQAWFGSGLMLIFLLITTGMRIGGTTLDLLKLLSPTTLLPRLIPSKFLWAVDIFRQEADYFLVDLKEWQWFHFPIGATVPITLGMMMLSYGIGIWGIWQVLNRCFRNPHATMLSKRQSYVFSGYLAILGIGFALQPKPPIEISYYYSEWLPQTLQGMLLGILVLSLGLIAILSPSRQTCIDWARYRYQQPRQSLLRDLVWGEKSPAVLAIALNIIILHAPLIAWVGFWSEKTDKSSAIFCIVLNASLICLYAGLAQLVLFMPFAKRGLWATNSVGVAIALPPITLLLLGIKPEAIPGLWLFTVFPGQALTAAPLGIVGFTFIAQICMVSLLSFQLTRRLRQAGESASKALLASR